MEQEFEIRTLAVLHIIDMPAARGRILHLTREPEKSPCRVDVARLGGDHENGVHPIHRNDTNEAGERAFALGLQNPLEFTGALGRIAVADRE